MLVEFLHDFEQELDRSGFNSVAVVDFACSSQDFNRPGWGISTHGSVQLEWPEVVSKILDWENALEAFFERFHLTSYTFHQAPMHDELDVLVEVVYRHRNVRTAFLQLDVVPR